MGAWGENCGLTFQLWRSLYSERALSERSPVDLSSAGRGHCAGPLAGGAEGYIFHQAAALPASGGFLKVMTARILWMPWQSTYALRNPRSAPVSTAAAVGISLFDVLWLAFLLWNGMIRAYLASAQLGIKRRVLAALCGWIFRPRGSAFTLLESQERRGSPMAAWYLTRENIRI